MSKSTLLVDGVSQQARVTGRTASAWSRLPGNCL